MSQNIDWGNLGFGYVQTDYRYVSNYKNGAWDEGVITYNFLGNDVVVGNNLVFKDINDSNLVFSVGFDSRDLTGIGFINDSQFELVGNYEFIKNTLMVDSKRNRSTLVYASCGLNESSSAGLYGGYSFIFENGKLLNNNERFDFDSNIIFLHFLYPPILYMRIHSKIFHLILPACVLQSFSTLAAFLILFEFLMLLCLK